MLFEWHIVYLKFADAHNPQKNFWGNEIVRINYVFSIWIFCHLTFRNHRAAGEGEASSKASVPAAAASRVLRH